MSLISRSWSDCRTVWNRYFPSIAPSTLPIRAEAYIWTGQELQKFEKNKEWLSIFKDGIGWIGLDGFQEYAKNLKDAQGNPVRPTKEDYHLTVRATLIPELPAPVLSLIARVLDYILSWFKKIDQALPPSLPPYLPSALLKNVKENDTVAFEWKGRRYEYILRQQLSPLEMQKKNIEALFQELQHYMTKMPSFTPWPSPDWEPYGIKTMEDLCTFFWKYNMETLLALRGVRENVKRLEYRYRFDNFLSDLDQPIVMLSMRTPYQGRPFSDRAALQIVYTNSDHPQETPSIQTFQQSIEQGENEASDLLLADGGQYKLIMDAPGEIKNIQAVVDQDRLTICVHLHRVKQTNPQIVKLNQQARDEAVESRKKKGVLLVPPSAQAEFVFVDVIFQKREISFVGNHLYQHGVHQFTIGFRDPVRRQEAVAP
jgi:hypothetical protein